MSIKEKELSNKERNLKIEADVVAQLYRQWIVNGNKVQVTLEELKLWKQQAKAIERSPNHLETIDSIIQKVEAGFESDNLVLKTCEVDLVVFRTLLRDRTKFNQLAFSLIAEQNQSSQDPEQYNFDFE
ncbi:MAG: hypothetical protein QNJ72_14325 [Pleurocapsa sp. MO_226.B13]|nr:hypothetical protein [Pleurocapsa sp. MO_226.B13]